MVFSKKMGMKVGNFQVVFPLWWGIFCGSSRNFFWGKKNWCFFFNFLLFSFIRSMRFPLDGGRSNISAGHSLNHWDILWPCQGMSSNSGIIRRYFELWLSTLHPGSRFWRLDQWRSISSAWRCQSSDTPFAKNKKMDIGVSKNRGTPEWMVYWKTL